MILNSASEYALIFLNVCSVFFLVFFCLRVYKATHVGLSGTMSFFGEDIQTQKKMFVSITE